MLRSNLLAIRVRWVIAARKGRAQVAQRVGVGPGGSWRPGVRVIAKQFGVDPGTVQRISHPFAAASEESRWSQYIACGGASRNGKNQMRSKSQAAWEAAAKCATLAGGTERLKRAHVIQTVGVVGATRAEMRA